MGLNARTELKANWQKKPLPFSMVERTVLAFSLFANIHCEQFTLILKKKNFEFDDKNNVH